MKPLDDELRNLFKRKEPPVGFAGRVLARLEAPPAPPTLTERLSALFRRPVVRWVAVPVACALVALGVVRYQHQQRMRVQAEQASREAMLALQITNEELSTALERAQRVTVRALEVKNNQSEKRSDL
ncbi:MAG: hypothetical protein P8Z30_12215 [Acidobacteriota bacterium]